MAPVVFELLTFALLSVLADYQDNGAGGMCLALPCPPLCSNLHIDFALLNVCGTQDDAQRQRRDLHEAAKCVSCYVGWYYPL